MTDNADFTEATISLNGFELVIASTNDALKVTLGSDVLASKTIIYAGGSDESLPFVEIIVREHAADSFQHEVAWWTTERLRPVASGFASNDEGADAAELLLRLLYRAERSWHEYPKLGALRLRKHTTKPIGFPSS